MQRPADFEGTFHLLSNIGRLGPVWSGYKPTHKLFDNYFSSGHHEYDFVEKLHPGETAFVRVWLITPDVYPKSIWAGRVLEVFEGQKLIGQIDISVVNNFILLGQAENYNPIWVLPPSFEADPVK